MERTEFLTEKQTEALLEMETRILPLPDGSNHPIRTFKLWWETYDRILLISDYSPAQLMGFALEETQLSGHPLEKTLPSVVSYLDCNLRDYLRGRGVFSR